MPGNFEGMKFSELVSFERAKESMVLMFCYKWGYFNPYIFATQCCRP